jgi:beta-carotene 3-hydroxylase
MSFLIIFTTFCAIEFVVWFTPKFVMHRFSWNLYLHHHLPKRAQFFKKNDAFFLIYTIPSGLLIILSFMFAEWNITFSGFEILAYGIAYFLVHEVFIHQRLKWFRNIDNTYLRAVRRAHKIHYKYIGKEEGECFGMLIVPWKYLRQELKKTTA